MIKRKLEEPLRNLAKQFRVVLITGPRQSGKTTIATSVFKEYKYANFEDPRIREFAQKDPYGFLREYDENVIFDEIQHVPELLSYIQGVVDEKNIHGQFILTGSHNLLLLEAVSQSLAGRVGILHLLPLSLQEISAGENFEEYVYRGMYPSLYESDAPSDTWYANYIQTYVERDVRQIQKITDLSQYQVFMKLCAGRVGQVINYSSLANDCGLSHTAVKQWLSVLEASFIVYTIHPYYKNFNKRLIKMPKLYFYDTGIASTLLGFRSSQNLMSHPLRGGLFENFVMNELVKNFTNRGERPELYYWRDHPGYQIDCLLEWKGHRIAIQIKSHQTPSGDDLQSFSKWQKINPGDRLIVIYAGNETQKRTTGTILSWRDIETIFE